MSSDEIETVSQNELAEIPPHKLWLHFLHPALITPETLKKGGMTNIYFYRPTGELALVVTRSLYSFKAYEDKPAGFFIQDELGIPEENERIPFNMDLTTDLEIAGPPKKTTEEWKRLFNKHVDIIKDLLCEDGSRIVARSRDYGEESRLESKNGQWEMQDIKNKKPQGSEDAQLTSGHLQLPE